MDIELNLEGEHGQISVANLQGALEDLLDLLDDAAACGDIAKQTWRVTNLRAGSAHVAMDAPDGRDVALVVRRGMDELATVAAIPSGWTRRMVQSVLNLGRRVGTGGTTSMTLRLGASDRLSDFSSVLTDHAERALGEQTAAYGSLRGEVKRWNEAGRREVGIQRGNGLPPVTAHYTSALSDRIVSEAVGHEIEAWGIVRRNAIGQIAGMSIEDFRVVEPQNQIAAASLAGVLSSSGLTLESWLSERHED